jgi:hypothetical protein
VQDLRVARVAPTPVASGQGMHRSRGPRRVAVAKTRGSRTPNPMPSPWFISCWLASSPHRFVALRVGGPVLYLRVHCLHPWLTFPQYLHAGASRLARFEVTKLGTRKRTTGAAEEASDTRTVLCGHDSRDALRDLHQRGSSERRKSRTVSTPTACRTF